MARRITAAAAICIAGLLLLASCGPVGWPAGTRPAEASGPPYTAAATPTPGPTDPPAATKEKTPGPTETPEPTAEKTDRTTASSGGTGVAQTAAPTPRPTATSTPRPTATSTTKPTAAPTTKPTAAPTTRPTAAPTTRPTAAPTATASLAVQPGEAPRLDTSHANDEYVLAACNETATIKIGIRKDGCTEAFYTVVGDGAWHSFPITDGEGSYTVSLYRNLSGSSYVFVVSERITVTVEDPYAKYLQSNSIVNWNSGMSCVQFAASLMTGKTTEKAKAEAVYQWIVSHVTYDFDKASSNLIGYSSNPETTYDTHKGICLDFAVLYASMLRGNGIHCSVNYGYAEGINGYHAWNQIYVDGGWYTVDISSDSQYRASGVPYSMYKDRNKYNTQKMY